ncbi:MAG: HPr family phosphocarrier protein [Candidatus Dormibacterales bacterium]
MHPARAGRAISEAAAEVVVAHEHGLHLRPAADFVRAASDFASDIRVADLTRAPQRTASARSLLQITALGIDRGHTVRIAALGEDAEEAVAALARLVESNFPAPP